MKFINHIIVRVTTSLVVVIGVWSVLFYWVIVDEINDETDDVLEDYSAMIIQRFLSGEQMPSNDNGSNNTYYLRRVSADSLSVVKSNEGFSNEEIFIKYKGEDEPARILRQLFRDADDNFYEVTVITPTIDSKDLIEAIWRSLAILFLLLVVIIVLINAVAIKGAMRPLDRFMKWLHASNIETCELPQIEKSNIREIGELSNAIETFAQRGRRAFEEQKEFIENASHELQTPIAICQNHLELLLESRLDEQQISDVAGCLSTLQRLARLNRSLLMLSKIENGGFEKRVVDINDLVRGQVEMLEELYAHRNIKLTFLEEGSCQFEMNSDLAATLIVNLVKNSYSHNIDGGVIDIKVAEDAILISNSGVQEALDGKKIFNRFYQGGTKSGTSGLGLAIVSSICKLYGFSVGYSFADNLHQFKIKFK
ncbi:MAG: HAMP domain-containing sensor histidine kinase [Rikenellaceae bacterium]